MTWQESESIDEAVAALGYNAQVKKLEQGAARALHDRFRSKCCPGSEGTFYWDGFVEPSAYLRDPEGWRRVEEFVRPCMSGTQEDVYLFFNWSDDHTVYCLPLNLIVPILAECGGFEFYVADEQCAFAFCHNHHDAICLQGKAAILTRSAGP